MKQFTKLLWTIIILGSFIMTSVPADAKAYIYAGNGKKINCGVIRVQGATQNLAGNPPIGNLFYWLDQRTDMKPSGWSFENPLAPGSPSTGLPKVNPAYWTIDLSSVRDLSMMQVLYLPASGTVRLNDHDREKLRRFVDGGGVLWIDNADKSDPLTFTDASTGNDTFFIKDVKFDTSSSGYDYPNSRHHPLLTVPFWITEPEIMSLGAYPSQCTLQDTNIFGSKEPFAFDVLLPVVSKGSSMDVKTSIGAIAYGSGRIVATSNFVGGGCYFNYPHELPNLKFAYNVIAWASSWTHLRKDPRHSGASIDTVGGTRLINMWTLPGANPNSNVDSAAVIYKNVVFYTSGTKVYALDLRPQDDLDQDGNPDDGVQGLPDGMPDQGQDIIWVWDCGLNGGDSATMLSSPTVVSAAVPPTPPNTAVKTIDAVMVMSSSGVVYWLDAFPPGARPGQIAPVTTQMPLAGSNCWAIGVPIDNPYPPLYENGWIYAVAGNGVLYAYSPALDAWKNMPGNSGSTAPINWEMPTMSGAVANPSTATPRSGPSFGYVENDGGGSILGIVYWYTSYWTNPTAPTTAENDYINGAPVMVSKDRLKIENISGGVVQCQATYTDGRISDVPIPRIWYVPPGGSAPVEVPETDITVVDPDRGKIRFNYTGVIQSDTLVYGSYALTYGSAAGAPVVSHPLRVKQPLEPRIGTGGTTPTKIVGIPAMGPNDMIYVAGERGLSTEYGGSVYGISNDGNTQSTKWHYFLHPGLPTGVAGTSAEGIYIPGAVADVVKDAAGNVVDQIPMVSPMPYSSPVVVGDKVFVTVSRTSDGPKGALMCFKANSDFVIRITENAGVLAGKATRKPKRLISDTTNREMLVKVWQPNLLSSSQFVVNPLIEARPVPKEMIDYEKGTITIDNFDRIKITSAADPTVTNTLSPSLPVWVYLDNVEVPIDFSTWGPSVGIDNTLQAKSRDSVDLSGWNNLLWYYLIPDSTVHNSPVVIGDKVYVVADDGTIYALNAETGETAGTMTTQKPLWKEKMCEVCPAFSGNQNVSAAGSNGVLLVPGSDGLYAYTNAITLTADSNRVAELDGAGDLSWAVDSIMWPESIPPSTKEPPAARTGPINKPARVKYIGTGDILLVNSGANQVAKIDKVGMVGLSQFNGRKYVRWIFDEFTDPKNLLRPGQSTRLSAPTDAILWQEVDGTDVIVHCVVADSGNYRVVDLVYRSRNGDLLNSEQDPGSGYYLPELNWVSKTDSVNDRYVYNSLQLVPVYTGSPQVLAGHNIWAAISTHHTGTDSPMADVKDMGRGGAVVALKYRDLAGTSWDYNSSSDSGTIIASCDRVRESGSGGQVLLSNPRSFEMFQIPGSPENHLLIADDNGVFEANISTNPPTLVGSIFTDEKYRNTPRVDVGTPGAPNLIPIGAPLMANSVQRLPNKNWLITNGFLGTYNDSSGTTRKFTGEVFELNPATGDVVWCSPGIVPMPDGWIQSMSNSYMIQQPRSAFRRY